MKTAGITAISAVLVIFWGAIALCQDGASDRGREVYATQKCALCHSINGVGGKKMVLDKVGSRLKAEDMKKWVRTPKTMKADSTMKAYPNLPEQDLSDLVAFLTTLR